MDFFCGVPDSLLKDFCAYVTANSTPDRHVITANEGSAIALASGHYLATKKWPLVYMQNSGLGNTVNPIMSLAHSEVYRYVFLIITIILKSYLQSIVLFSPWQFLTVFFLSIPMLLMVGWRGEPGKKDEPQHVVQGETTPALLASIGVPFQVLPDFIEGAEKALQTAKKYFLFFSILGFCHYNVAMCCALLHLFSAHQFFSPGICKPLKDRMHFLSNVRPL